MSTIYPDQAESIRIENRNRITNHKLGMMRMQTIYLLKRCFQNIRRANSASKAVDVVLSDAERNEIEILRELVFTLKTMGYTCDFTMKNFGVDPHNPRKEHVMVLRWGKNG